jgi:hypothetical protein
MDHFSEFLSQPSVCVWRREQERGERERERKERWVGGRGREERKGRKRRIIVIENMN